MHKEREMRKKRGLEYQRAVQIENREHIKSPIPPYQDLEVIVYGEFRFKDIYKKEFETILTIIARETKPSQNHTVYVLNRYYENELEFIAYYNVAKCIELAIPVLRGEHTSKRKPITPEDIISICIPH